MRRSLTYKSNINTTYGSIIFNGARPDGSKIVSDNGWITPSLNYTFSIWIKCLDISASTDNSIILGSRVGTTSRWELYRSTNNKISLGIRRGSFLVNIATPINTIITGAWHNVTLTRSSLGVYTIYVDSVVTNTSSAVATDEISPSTRKAIGSSVNNSNAQTNRSFNGNLCHASFWNKELLLAEVQELYNSGTLSDLNATSFSADLLSWQKMDFSETLFPTVIGDASGNGNTFTSSNLVIGDLVNDYPS